MCLWFHVSLRESWICSALFHRAIYLPKSSAIQVCESGPLHELLVSVVAVWLFCPSSCSYCSVRGTAREFTCRKAQIRVPWSQTLTVRKALRGCDLNVPFQKCHTLVVTVWQSWGLEHSQIKASWMRLRPLQKRLLSQHPLYRMQDCTDSEPERTGVRHCEEVHPTLFNLSCFRDSLVAAKLILRKVPWDVFSNQAVWRLLYNCVPSCSVSPDFMAITVKASGSSWVLEIHWLFVTMWLLQDAAITLSSPMQLQVWNLATYDNICQGRHWAGKRLSLHVRGMPLVSHLVMG